MKKPKPVKKKLPRTRTREGKKRRPNPLKSIPRGGIKGIDPLMAAGLIVLGASILFGFNISVPMPGDIHMPGDTSACEHSPEEHECPRRPDGTLALKECLHFGRVKTLCHICYCMRGKA